MTYFYSFTCSRFQHQRQICSISKANNGLVAQNIEYKQVKVYLLDFIFTGQ